MDLDTLPQRDSFEPFKECDAALHKTRLIDIVRRNMMS